MGLHHRPHPRDPRARGVVRPRSEPYALPILQRTRWSLRTRGSISGGALRGYRSPTTSRDGFPIRPCSTQLLRWHFVNRNHPNGLLIEAVTSSLRINHDPNPLEHGAEDRTAAIE
jgi:hypothetical protein